MAAGLSGCGTHAHEGGLSVYTTADPAHPRLVGRFDTPGLAKDVLIRGTLAFVSDTETGLVILDVSDPAHPTLAGSCDTTGYAYDVVLAGSHAFLADLTGGMVAIDVTHPAAPVQVASVKTGGRACSLALAEAMAVVAAEEALVLVRIANPNQPPRLSGPGWSPAAGTRLNL